jgi:hypothetical protein
MRGDAQTEAIAQLVARYLAAHPEASDTLDGIARWWLDRQRFDDAKPDVLRALEALERRGVVERRRLANGLTLFRRARH